MYISIYLYIYISISLSLSLSIYIYILNTSCRNNTTLCGILHCIFSYLLIPMYIFSWEILVHNLKKSNENDRKNR